MTLWANAPCALILMATVAHARGGEAFTFKVPLPQSVRQKPEGVTSPPEEYVMHEGGAIVLRDRRLPEKEQLRLRFPLAAREGEWLTWWRIHGDVLVFAWREFPRDATYAHGLDVIRGVHIPSGRELWKLPIPGYASQVFKLTDQRVLVQADTELWALEAVSGKVIWRTAANGSAYVWLLRSVLLLAEPDRLTRVDPATGRILWSAEVIDPAGAVLFDGVLYLVEFVQGHESGIEARFLQLDAKKGKVLERRVLHKYSTMHDRHGARVRISGATAEVELHYVILD